MPSIAIVPSEIVQNVLHHVRKGFALPFKTGAGWRSRDLNADCLGDCSWA